MPIKPKRSTTALLPVADIRTRLSDARSELVSAIAAARDLRKDLERHARDVAGMRPDIVTHAENQIRRGPIAKRITDASRRVAQLRAEVEAQRAHYTRFSVLQRQKLKGATPAEDASYRAAWTQQFRGMARVTFVDEVLRAAAEGDLVKFAVGAREARERNDLSAGMRNQIAAAVDAVKLDDLVAFDKISAELEFVVAETQILGIAASRGVIDTNEAVRAGLALRAAQRELSDREKEDFENVETVLRPLTAGALHAITAEREREISAARAASFGPQRAIGGAR